jgi:S1-C subfamily serine protease
MSHSGQPPTERRSRHVGLYLVIASAIDPEFNTPANGVGFAIPSNRVQFIAPQLINSGKVVHSGRASLGAQVITVNPTMAAQNQLPVDHDALVVGVPAHSPAEQAGLHVDDIIVQVDTTPVESAQQLQDLLLQKDVGQMVSLKIYRGKQQLTVKVKLAELQVPSYFFLSSG